ncbi:aminoacyltransferase [Helicobacter anatolicus]|nr:aminoacyltransferase [Helicobacter anatolicus]MCE3037690.1 aminoacyltransferase [Helicobacter anatolicus]
MENKMENKMEINVDEILSKNEELLMQNKKQMKLKNQLIKKTKEFHNSQNKLNRLIMQIATLQEEIKNVSN